MRAPHSAFVRLSMRSRQHAQAAEWEQVGTSAPESAQCGEQHAMAASMILMVYMPDDECRGHPGEAWVQRSMTVMRHTPSNLSECHRSSRAIRNPDGPVRPVWPLHLKSNRNHSDLNECGSRLSCFAGPGTHTTHPRILSTHRYAWRRVRGLGVPLFGGCGELFRRLGACHHHLCETAVLAGNTTGRARAP